MSPPPDSLSLSQLRCLVAVIDARSFAEAGRRLALTTSGVSKTVARLEALYGVRLLHRSTHSISATEAGDRLLGLARTVLVLLSHKASACSWADADSVADSR